MTIMMTLSVKMDADFLAQFLEVARMTINLDITDAHFKQHVGSATLTITNTDTPNAELHVVECPPSSREERQMLSFPATTVFPATRLEAWRLQATGQDETSQNISIRIPTPPRDRYEHDKYSLIFGGPSEQMGPPRWPGRGMENVQRGYSQVRQPQNFQPLHAGGRWSGMENLRGYSQVRQPRNFLPLNAPGAIWSDTPLSRTPQVPGGSRDAPLSRTPQIPRSSRSTGSRKRPHHVDHVYQGARTPTYASNLCNRKF